MYAITVFDLRYFVRVHVSIRKNKRKETLRSKKNTKCSEIGDLIISRHMDLLHHCTQCVSLPSPIYSTIFSVKEDACTGCTLCYSVCPIIECIKVIRSSVR